MNVLLPPSDPDTHKKLDCWSVAAEKVKSQAVQVAAQSDDQYYSFVTEKKSSPLQVPLPARRPSRCNNEEQTQAQNK